MRMRPVTTSEGGVSAQGLYRECGEGRSDQQHGNCKPKNDGPDGEYGCLLT
jgi:hypothetical protein